MNGTAALFALVSAVALLVLPRRWAPLPLLAGACYMTVGQKIELGPFTFTVLRILIAVGFVRVAVRGEKLVRRWNSLDSLLAASVTWLCVSSAFHNEPGATLVTHLGAAYNIAGIYFLLRSFCSTLDDAIWLCRAAALVLVPVALEMAYEQVAFRNLFAVLGGVPEFPQIRDGRIRAFGPFTHPILAGTVGGVTLPLMIGIWRANPVSGTIGIGACLAMVTASASSGPLVSACVAVLSLCMWRLRQYMRLFRWSLVIAYLGLLIVMERPPYYIIQRLEVVGGSTGWYRSRLIESSIEHLDEWWLGGTDFTRHWMTESTAISANHTDITNQYLALGVMGGLGLVILFVAALTKGFSLVGRGMQRAREERAPAQEFMLWAYGCSLAAHTITFMSVSYFDQSFVFLYLTLAVIASLGTAAQPALADATAPEKAGRLPVMSRGRPVWRPRSQRPKHGDSQTSPRASLPVRRSMAAVPATLPVRTTSRSRNGATGK